VKRSGDRELFDRAKIFGGVRSACKNRPLDDESINAIVEKVEEAVRLLGRDVSSEEVGLATMNELRAVDAVAYVRFASVYKGFEDADDFAREIGMLIKTTAPKLRS
jgi:transcriptional repressor NrdR